MGSASALRGLPGRATYPGTDWTAFVPVTSWTTNVTNTGFWKQNGADMELEIYVLCTGAPTATTLSFNLPSGYNIDPTKITAGGMPVGIARIRDAGVLTYTGVCNIAATSGNTAIFTISLPSTAADLSNTVPFTFGINDQVQVFAKIPILGWTAQTVVTERTQPEYVYNSSVNNTTSDTVSFQTGEQGALIGNITATINRRVQFSSTIKSDERVALEVSDDRIAWFETPVAFINNQVVSPYIVENTTAYGIGIDHVSSTQVDVYFGQYAGMFGKTTVGGAGQAWSIAAGAGYWRVRRVKPSQLLGVQSATSTVEGIIKGAQVPGSPGTAAIAAGFSGQTLSSSFTVAHTASGTPQQLTNIVLPQGEWILSASAALVNQGGGTLVGTNNTVMTMSLSNNSNTPIFGSSYSQIQQFIPNNINASGAVYSHVIPNVPLTVPSTTTVYLNAQVLYSGTAPNWTGAILAKRI